MSRNGSRRTMWLGLGVVFGVLLGRLMHNQATGMGLGVALGVVIGRWDRRGSRESPKTPPVD